MNQRLVVLAFSLLALGCQTTGGTAGATAPSRLEATPRHDEWVDVPQGSRTLRAYVVHPQRSDKAPVVLVIHENRGLTDWVRSVADRLAEEGYIAVAPDLLSGAAPNGGGTKDFPSEDAARQAIGSLPRPQVLADLAEMVRYARSIPSASGRVAVSGFCWGGARTWDAVTEVGGVDAGFVFYGPGVQDAEIAKKDKSPVFGFYGGNDERVNATIPKSEEAMRAAGRRFEPVIYPGAGHAFMRLGEAADATEANRAARQEAWKRWLALLAETFRAPRVSSSHVPATMASSSVAEGCH